MCKEERSLREDTKYVESGQELTLMIIDCLRETNFTKKERTNINFDEYFYWVLTEVCNELKLKTSTYKED